MMNAKGSRTAFILVSLVVISHQTVISPCPKVFSYEYANGEWFGFVTVPSVGVEKCMKLNVTLSVKHQLPSTYQGHIQLSGDPSDVYSNIIGGQNIRYRVTLPTLLNEVPKIASIVFNGKIYCEAPPASATAKEIRLSHVVKTGINTEKKSDSINDNRKHIVNILSKPSEIGNRVITKPRTNMFYEIHSNVFDKIAEESNTTPNNLEDRSVNGGVNSESDAMSVNNPNAAETEGTANRYLNRDFLSVSDALPENSSLLTLDKKTSHDPVGPEYQKSSEEDESVIVEKNTIINTTPKKSTEEYADRIVFVYDPSFAERLYVGGDRPPVSLNTNLNQQGRPNTEESTDDTKLLEDFIFPVE